jgi:CRISPR-associated protein (TIGR03986 family)
MPDLKSWSEHQNPTREERTARAPYNFVPLPEKIIPAVQDADQLPPHDCYDPERHSGYFDVMLTTRSPLYIRGLAPAEEFQRQNQDVNKPEFFYTRDPRQPVIPGSSLRGMLRALLEIVSYSKMQWVSEKQLFFRTVDRTAIGKYYNSRMVEELGDVQIAAHPSAPGYRAQVEGGFFHVRNNGTYYIEECTVARVETDDLLGLFGLTQRHELYEVDGRALAAGADRNPNQTPKWSYQHREIWADIDGAEKDYFFPKQLRPDGRPRHPNLYLRFRRAWNLTATKAPGKRSGKLVLTGHMNFKHLAFLFAPIQQPRLIEIPNDPHEQDPNKRLVDRFHDDDQLTQWQTKAFPVGRSPTSRLQPDGRLRDGDPVFFLRENGKLIFFGRAQMFRLPYKLRPIDLVPDHLRRATDIDYAEALFGFVRTRQQLEELKELGMNAPQGDKRRAYASRVSVTDAVLQPDQTNIWLAENSNTAITPKILATPKPTAFQMYLTQQQPDEPGNLDHYDTKLLGGKTAIRVHKLYWHKGLGTDQGLTLEEIRGAIEEQNNVPPGDTQHTRFKPLKPGVTFSFRIHFENLSKAELGALCWTLHPRGEAGRRYCHHLGMGKPLGMGAVELHARLHIIDRALRYSALFSGDDWQTGDSPTGVSQTLEGGDLAHPDVLARLTQPFEAHLLGELNPQPPCTRLADMRRIAMLLKLLEWPGQEREKTRYMMIQRNREHRGAPQDDNEYRSRPVLPDPTSFDAPSFVGKSRPPETPAGVNQRGQAAAPPQQHKPETPHNSQPSQPDAPPLTEDQVFAWLRHKNRVTGTVVEQSSAGAILKLDDPTAQPGQQIPRGLLVRKPVPPVDTRLTCLVKGIVAGQKEWFVKLE